MGVEFPEAIESTWMRTLFFSTIFRSGTVFGEGGITLLGERAVRYTPFAPLTGPARLLSSSRLTCIHAPTLRTSLLVRKNHRLSSKKSDAAWAILLHPPLPLSPRAPASALAWGPLHTAASFCNSCRLAAERAREEHEQSVKGGFERIFPPSQTAPNRGARYTKVVRVAEAVFAKISGYTSSPGSRSPSPTR